VAAKTKAEDETDHADDQQDLSNGLNVDRAHLAQVDGLGDDGPEGDHEQGSANGHENSLSRAEPSCLPRER
jgi:hypothetical protein